MVRWIIRINLRKLIHLNVILFEADKFEFAIFSRIHSK